MEKSKNIKQFFVPKERDTFIILPPSPPINTINNLNVIYHVDWKYLDKGRILRLEDQERKSYTNEVLSWINL